VLIVRPLRTCFQGHGDPQDAHAGFGVTGRGVPPDAPGASVR
jgi:hypothetical protein